MLAQQDLLEQLDGFARRDIRKRADALRRVADLFVSGAGRFSEEQIALFDEVMGRLLVEIDQSARAAFGRRLAQIAAAPPRVMRGLALDDAIDVAAPVLSQSEVGAATSLLTDALINAPAQRATSKLFGLTRFEINPVIGGTTGSTPAARLTLGRRISKEVTVTYSTNVTSDPNQILALEYRVSDRLSFLAQYEQASTRRLSARTNNFNFEIRFRKRF